MNFVVTKLNKAQIRMVTMDGNSTLNELETLPGTESGILIFITSLVTSFVYISTETSAMTIPRNSPLDAV